MFERLFHYPKVLARHAEAPLRAERERFLQHCADQGMAYGTLISKANELMVIARRLSLSAGKVTREQVHSAAERWARHQRRRGRCHALRWSRERFAQVATDWLTFMGRFEIEQPELPGAQWIKPFAAYMRDERGLSPHTIRTSGWFIAKFFSQLTTQQRTLAQATISDGEDFLTSASEHGWCRVSLAKSAKVLRAFFRYAESRGWCAAGIAAAIIGPRVFRDEGLPRRPPKFLHLWPPETPPPLN